MNGLGMCCHESCLVNGKCWPQVICFLVDWCSVGRVLWVDFA